MKSLISPDKARCQLRRHLPKTSAINCPLAQCNGRFLREKIVTDRPFPPFDRSMMDGYAIRTCDLAKSDSFQITRQIPAGSLQQKLGKTISTCAEIMTGAVVPKDTDCVVPYEATERIDETHIRLIRVAEHTKGDFIHKLGSDRAEGAALLDSGRKIGSREIAIAASCGYTHLLVSKSPSIAVVSTGDELVNIAEIPASHQIRRSNDIMINFALYGVGLTASQMIHLPDDSEISAQKISQLTAENDIVIISGGISMGKKDYIPEVLDHLGLKCHFHGVTQKPGKPFGFWSDPKRSVFTLPGNPLSTLFCLHHYVIPALLESMGLSAEPEKRNIRIDSNIAARDDWTLFIPIKLIGANEASPRPVQNSGDLAHILDSDGYIEVQPTPDRGYSAGTNFDFHTWY